MRSESKVLSTEWKQIKVTPGQLDAKLKLLTAWQELQAIQEVLLSNHEIKLNAMQDRLDAAQSNNILIHKEIADLLNDQPR